MHSTHASDSHYQKLSTGQLRLRTTRLLCVTICCYMDKRPALEPSFLRAQIPNQPLGRHQTNITSVVRKWALAQLIFFDQLNKVCEVDDGITKIQSCVLTYITHDTMSWSIFFLLTHTDTADSSTYQQPATLSTAMLHITCTASLVLIITSLKNFVLVAFAEIGDSKLIFYVGHLLLPQLFISHFMN